MSWIASNWLGLLIIALVLAGIGYYLLWGRHDEEDDGGMLVLREDDQEDDGPVDTATLDIAEQAAIAGTVLPDVLDDQAAEDDLDAEPSDGDAYAAELHAIAQAAAADYWQYDSLAILKRMPLHWITLGYNVDDWLRCNLPHKDYMRWIDKEERRRLKRWAREDERWLESVGYRRVNGELVAA